MNRVVESSVVVQTLRWLARESVVAAWVRRALRPFQRLDDAFARASADKASQVDPVHLYALIRESRAVRTLDQAFSLPSSAWVHSRARPFIESIAQTVAVMPVWERIRLLGWMLAVAVITRAALYMAGGEPVTAATLAVWGMVILTALLMIVGSRHIAVAWEQWNRRRR
jgi:hypothetical protein